jgi:hypothetical protein
MAGIHDRHDAFASAISHSRATVRGFSLAGTQGQPWRRLHKPLTTLARFLHARSAVDAPYVAKPPKAQQTLFLRAANTSTVVEVGADLDIDAGCISGSREDYRGKHGVQSKGESCEAKSRH